MDCYPTKVWVHSGQVASPSQSLHIETNNHSRSHSLLRAIYQLYLPLEVHGSAI